MTRRRRPLAALAPIATVALISACGSSAPVGDGDGSHTTTTHLKALKFAECMRNNGVSAFPDPPASGELTIDRIANRSSLDPNSTAFKQAIGACRDLEPAGFTGTKRSPQQMEAALKFAQCMRDDGVSNFPDPTENGPLINVHGAHSIPGFQATADKCLAAYRGELGLAGK